MQYIYENFTFPADQSFAIRSELIELKKHTKLRSYLNFKITLLENCTGKHFIGDHIADFQDTELVLLGSYLPHCWQYHEFADPMARANAIEIHFFPDFLGKQFLEKPEAKSLNLLFQEKAPKGISYGGETVSQAKVIMHQMLLERGFERVVSMLRLLDVLVKSKSFSILSSPYFHSIDSSTEAQKINKVFDYVFANFKKEIRLPEVAKIVPMSTSAFCRFFREKTGQTLVDFIKEVRIGHAAKLMLEGQHNVAEACYSSGYNSISNFNRHFKEIKGVPPRQFMEGYK